MTAPKPGFATSEFWATVSVNLLGVVGLFFPTGHLNAVATGVVHAVCLAGPTIATLVYTLARARVKVAHVAAQSAAAAASSTTPPVA